ncbi:MAG: hypothetical protein MZU95_03250 [Desulfomicrobium escambiense]|nr:hypothetical protein [Desulfomicrobium escambiense]
MGTDQHEPGFFNAADYFIDRNIRQGRGTQDRADASRRGSTPTTTCRRW